MMAMMTLSLLFQILSIQTEYKTTYTHIHTKKNFERIKKDIRQGCHHATSRPNNNAKLFSATRSLLVKRLSKSMQRHNKQIFDFRHKECKRCVVVRNLKLIFVRLGEKKGTQASTRTCVFTFLL